MLVVMDDGIPSLHEKEAKLEICRVLLDAGADPNYENDIGISAIKLARESKDEDLIALLERVKRTEADETESSVNSSQVCYPKE